MENRFTGLPAEAAGMLALGASVGEHHTLSALSGRCSAAQAESLRRLREEKPYHQLGLTWEDFCVGYLRLSRSQADRIIANLEEFGPKYFELSQLTRVSAETYRQIESTVQDGAIQVHGESVPLVPENAHKVARAVAILRAKKAEDPPRTLEARIESLVRHFDTVFLWALHNDLRGYHKALRAALGRMQDLLDHKRDVNSLFIRDER